MLKYSKTRFFFAKYQKTREWEHLVQHYIYVIWNFAFLVALSFALHRLHELFGVIPKNVAEFNIRHNVRTHPTFWTPWKIRIFIFSWDIHRHLFLFIKITYRILLFYNIFIVYVLMKLCQHFYISLNRNKMFGI